jgi:hypothetical protein
VSVGANSPETPNSVLLLRFITVAAVSLGKGFRLTLLLLRRY